MARADRSIGGRDVPAGDRPAIRVLVVSDDALAREGLAAVLAAGSELIVAVQATGEEAVALASGSAADVVVWDLGLGTAQPPPLLAEAVEAGIPVLVLVPDADTASLAWSAGARGVLPREAERSRLRAAVEALAEGLTVGDPALGSAPSRGAASAGRLLEEMTPREQDVLQLLAQGLPNRAIADRLAITERTARFHTAAILGKLGAANRSEAIIVAHRLGLIVL